MLDAILSNWNYLAATVWAALINSLPITCLLTGIVWLVLDRNKKLSATNACLVWSAVLAFTVVLPIAQALQPHFTSGATSTPSCSLRATIAPSAPLLPETTPLTPEPPKTEPEASATPVLNLLSSLSLPALLLGIWLIATFVQLARLLFALHYSLSLKRSAAAPSGSLKTRWRYLLDHHYVSRRPVTLGLSSAVSVPAVVGYRRPMVLLPVSAVDLLDRDGLDAILLHELAHVQRRDDWAIAIQRLLEAFFVLHPLVHLITSKLELQREIACDDWVLASKERCAYAYSLTAIAEVSVLSPHASLMGLVVEQPSQLSQRIEKLLDNTRSIATGLSRKRIGSLAAAVLLICAASLRLPALMAAPADPHPVPVLLPPVPPAPPEPPVDPPAPVVNSDSFNDLAREQAKLAREQAELAKKQSALMSKQEQQAREQALKQMHDQLRELQTHRQHLEQNREQLKQQIEQMRRQLNEQLRTQLPQQINREVFANLQTQMQVVSKELARINTEEITRSVLQAQQQMRDLHSKINTDNIRPDLKAKLDQLQARQRQLAAEQQETARELQRTLNEALHDSLQKGQKPPAK